MVYYLVQDIPTLQLENSLSRLTKWGFDPEYDAFGEPTILFLLSMEERNMLDNTSQTLLQNMDDILTERKRIVYDRKITLGFHNRKTSCCVIT